MNKQKGFTLIELLVVIAIIGILASVVLVSVGGARNQANAAKATGDMSNVMMAAELAYSAGCPSESVTTSPIDCEGTTYLAVLPGDPDGGGSTWGYTFSGTASNYTLTATGFTDAACFRCVGGSCVCYTVSCGGTADTAKCKK